MYVINASFMTFSDFVDTEMSLHYNILIASVWSQLQFADIFQVGALYNIEEEEG